MGVVDRERDINAVGGGRSNIIFQGGYAKNASMFVLILILTDVLRQINWFNFPELAIFLTFRGLRKIRNSIS